jgi:long-chain acyl-CoA synthetase
MKKVESGDSMASIKSKIQKVAGKRLRWGLSAAGYLDPKVFRFFQDHDIHLCSGFGMTEATGGISMTPPGKYLEKTTGIALPGVYTRFGENNELEISGHYIANYLDEAGPGDKIAYPTGTEKDYWLPTGDIFHQTKEGYFEIIDRVKDIYKNNKGQTIAPKTVEKLFTDVPGIKQTFLVGDGKPYNVLLIVPDNDDPVLKASPDIENQSEYFHQIVTAANTRLAPYERVINFSLLNRDFELEKGELTPKGSFNRKAIEKNFGDIIEELYQSNVVKLSYKGIDVIIPRWFFRDLGILENDIILDGSGLINKPQNLRLPLRKEKNNTDILIGDLIYTSDNYTIDLGLFTRQPKLWIGNPSLINFCPCKEGWDIPVKNIRSQTNRPKVIKTTYSAASLPVLNTIKDQKIIFVNNLICLSLFGDSKLSVENTRQIGNIIKQYDTNITEVLRRRLEALSNHPDEEVRTLAYRILLLNDPNPDYSKLFPAFIQSGLTFLNEDSIHDIARKDMGKQQLESLRQRLYSYRLQLTWPAGKATRNQFENILKLLFNFASRHIEYYSPVRAELSSWILHKADPYLSKKAAEYMKDLSGIFEKSLAKRYTGLSLKEWNAKLIIDKGISKKFHEQLVKVVTSTTFIQQSVFLAYDEYEFDVKDIPDQGMWISRLMSYGDYKHYRISINTNYGKHFDLHVMINKNIRYSSGAETVYWLSSIADYPYATLSLPAMGCYMQKEGILSTKFISELSIWEKVREFSGIHHSLGYINIRNPWRKLMIKGLAVFYKAWQQSGYKIVPGAITPTNVVVPELDYLETATIISVAGLKKYQNTLSFVRPMVRNFFQMLVSYYPWSKKHLDVSWIFDACIEALGYKEANEFFKKLQKDLQKEPIIYFDNKNLSITLDKYLNDLSQKYYLPLALFNAIDQYKEWEKINSQATAIAKEQTIFELSGLYRIYQHPEIVRYYMYYHTYFAACDPEVDAAFKKLLEKLDQEFKLPAIHLIELSDLQAVLVSNDDKSIFSRMVFSRLREQQKLDIVKHGDDSQEQVIVKSYIQDKQGSEYIFREPLEPSEIGKLYRLFFEENYPKSISEMDKHMVVLDQQGRVIGGLCYIVLENHVVLLDGSAVTTPLKGRGIGTAMIDTFCSRMASEGVKVIKAHFLLGNFYLKLDFKVDQKWGALVKFL